MACFNNSNESVFSSSVSCLKPLRMRTILFTYILISFISCDPPILPGPMDSRQLLIVGTHWNWFSDDSVYLSGNRPLYLQRIKPDTCSETLYFQKGSLFTLRDSCDTQQAIVQQGSWYWQQGDSLKIFFPGSAQTKRSFRFTGDTLQLIQDNSSTLDSIGGHPVHSVKTFIRI
jgi:hypothetical protein